MKPFSKRMPHLGTENAFAVITKAKKFERESGINLVYLQIGEPGFDTPDNIKQATIKAIEGNETHYTPTPGIPTLRQAIADLTSENACVKYEPTDVVVVPGGKPVMFYLMSALLDEGDEVIIPNPSYPIYGSVTEYLGGKVVPIQLKEENDFNFTIEALEAKITDKTKLIMVNSPQNPTGGVYTRELLEGIAKLAVKHDLWVLSDEIYDRMVHDGEHVSITSFEGMPERTVVLNGCSKTYAMTGYRIGWSVCKNQQMTAYIEQLACNDTSCTNTMAQYAALEAITGPQDQVEYMLEEYKKRRNVMLKTVSDFFPSGTEVITPTHGFFMWLKLPIGYDTSKLFDHALDKAKVAFIPGHAFTPRPNEISKHCMRLNFSYNSPSIIQEGIERLGNMLEKTSLKVI